MKLINLKSDLSKFNKEFKSRNTFDSDKNNILDDSYKGKALVGTPLEINKTIEYQLKSKLVTEVSAPNNKSWRVPNPINIGSFYTPTSNYIDTTKLFYGGNIASYSKGTPLNSITFTSKLNKVDATYPVSKPYSFDTPFGYPTTYTNDFSLPFDSYTTPRVTNYSKGTPLNSITFTSKLNKVDATYPAIKPYLFTAPKGFIGTNDFSLPFVSYTTSRVGRYSRGTPLVPIGQVSKFDKDKDGIIDFPAVSGDDEKLHIDRKFRALLKKQFGSWNVRTIESTFATPLSNYIDSTKLFYGGNIAPYSKGTPLEIVAKESKWKSFDYPTTVPTTPYSFLKPTGFTGNNDFSLPYENRYTTLTLSRYSKGTPLDSIIFISKLDAKILTDGKEPLNYPAIKPYLFTAPKGFTGNNDFSLPFVSYTTPRVTNYSKGTPLVPIGKDSQWKLFKYPTTVPTTPYSFDTPFGYPTTYTNDFSLPFTKKYGTITFSKYGKYNVIPLNVASSFDINKDGIIDTEGNPNTGFRLLLTHKYGSWNIPNPKGGFYTPTSNYIDKTKPFYNSTGVFGNSKYLLKDGEQPVPLETKSTRNYPLNIGLDINKTYIQNLQQTYFGVSNLKSKFGDVNIASILAYTTNLTVSDLVYEAIADLQSNSVYRFGTLAQKWNTGGSLGKLNYISVGNVNDRQNVEFGDSYYGRASDKSDPIGLYNSIPNKSISWSGPLTIKEQPFVFYLPPDSKGYPMVIRHQGNIMADNFAKILRNAPRNSSRGASIIRERNMLGVRASDSILAINHFIQDTIRTTSVKPELPIKLYTAGATKAIGNAVASGLRSFFGVSNTTPKEFEDLENNPLEMDLVTFAIVYFDSELNYNKVIQFKSYLTQFNETISPEWSNGKFIGHPNNYYTYKGVTRSAQISFTIYSKNTHQREQNWRDINKLASMCYPQYSSAVGAQNRMQGPIIRLHLGSIYKGIPGFISNLTFTLNNNIPWDTGVRELPHGIEVNIGYTIIGHVLPEMDKNNHFDVFRYKRFDTTKGKYWEDPDPSKISFGTFFSVDESQSRAFGEKYKNRLSNTAASIVDESIGTIV